MNRDSDFIGGGKCPKCNQTVYLTDNHYCLVSDEEYNKRKDLQSLRTIIAAKEKELSFLKALLTKLEDGES